MTNLDLWLEKFGLCRLSFYTRMKIDYSKIILMWRGRVTKLDLARRRV